GSRRGTARTPWGAPRRRPVVDAKEIEVILMDTSVLVDGLTGTKRSGPAIRALLVEGERILLPALVLYEWLRGPRLPEELEAQDGLFPSAPAAGRSIWASPGSRAEAPAPTYASIIFRRKT